MRALKMQIASTRSLPNTSWSGNLYLLRRLADHPPDPRDLGNRARVIGLLGALCGVNAQQLGCRASSREDLDDFVHSGLELGNCKRLLQKRQRRGILAHRLTSSLIKKS